MKVIQINVTYGDVDSTGRNVKEFHKYLLSKGVDSQVYTTKINDSSKIDKRIHLFSSCCDQKVHAFLSRLTGRQGYFSYFTTKNLIFRLSMQKPDVIVLHVLHSNCINFPKLFKYLSSNNIPLVIVLHDCWYFTGHCCHFAELKCNQWEKECLHCPQIHKWNKSWFFDTARICLRDKKKWFTSISRLGVIGVSDWITREAQKSILKDATIIQRIYNWIDLDTFKPRNTSKLRRKLGIAENQKVILGVASGWSNQKGLREMISAAKQIPEAKIIMIGKIPLNIELPSNIIKVGVIKNPIELSEYYSLADVFLNPSVQETFGKTTAEALSCGTPVIVYNTTACTELVGNHCGKVVDKDDKEYYIQSIYQQLAENKESSSALCRKFAIKNFSACDRMRDYKEVLNAIIGISVKE